MGHVIGKDREQIELLCLDELVEPDSSARQIDKLVDETDTSYFEKSEAKGTGRSAYDPKDILKLHIYGFEGGVYSSRRLERECKRNIEVMWLLKGLQPDDKTICNFRRENAENLARFFNTFCMKLAKAGYIDGKVVAIDGTKIRANNSKRNNFSKKKLDRQIEHINDKLTEYIQELDKNDKIDELQKRKAKYESYKKQIESGDVSEVSTTDPDSRLMKQGNGGADVSYNVQTAVDGKHKLIAGVMVTNAPNDQGQLYKVAKSVKDNLELEKMIVPADKGYYDTDDFKDCEDDNITPIVAKPEKAETETGQYKKENFRYIPEKDAFLCPAGQMLKASKPDKNGYKRYRNAGACNHCPMKDKCTDGKRKDLGRHQYAEYAERNDRRLKENPDIYALRQSLSEHPFGTVKRTMGIRQFLTRGLANVTAEAALIFLAYNLKRLRSIQMNDKKQSVNAIQSVRLSIVLCLLAQNCCRNNYATYYDPKSAFLRSLPSPRTSRWLSRNRSPRPATISPCQALFLRRTSPFPSTPSLYCALRIVACSRHIFAAPYPQSISSLPCTPDRLSARICISLLFAALRSRAVPHALLRSNPDAIPALSHACSRPLSASAQ